MRRLRIIALGVAAAVVVGAVYQLPASPFERDDPAPRTAETPPAPDPSGAEVIPSEPTPELAGATPRQRAATPQITFPVRGTARYAVLPGHPTTIGSSGRLLRFRVR